MPKAIIRVYLLDGRWKAVVVDADLYTRQCIPLIASKLILTGKEDFSDYFLFESLDNGRVVNELPGASKPFDITQKWGPKSGNVNRFVFKRRTDKLKLYDTAFESQWRSSLIEDKTEIPKQQNLLAATRQTNQNSSPTVTPPISPRKEEEIIESPREEPQQEPAIAEPPKRKLPPGAQPLFFVGAKMVLPPAPKQRESSNFHDPMTSPRQVVTVDHSEIQNKRGNLKEKQNEKQQKLDVHKQSVLTWCNSILEKKNLSMKDLIQDLKSGVMLANILEICTGTTMKFAQNPRLAAQKLDNLSSCLNLLKQHGISVQGCTASDILNGNEPAVVGLMFLVVNKFKNVSSVASNRFSVVLTSQPIVVGAEPTPEPQTNTARDSVKPVPQKTSKPTPVDPAPQETEVPPAVPPVPVEEPQEPEEVPPPVPEPVEPTSDVPPAVPPVPVEEPEEIEDEIAPPVPPVPEEPIEEPVYDLPPVPPVPSEPVVTPYVVPEPEDLPPPLPEIPADFVAEDSQEELPPPVPPVPFPMPEILDQEDYLPEPVIPLPPIIEPQRAPSISKDSVPFIPPIIDPSDQLEAPPPVPPVPEHLMDPGMIDAQFEELNDFLTELANDLGVHTN